MSFGSPSTSASMITPKEDCSSVKLYSWFRMTFAFASRLRSMITFMPLRAEEKSDTFEMPSIFFSLCSSAMRSMSLDLLT